MHDPIKHVLCRTWQRVSALDDWLFHHGCDFASWMSQGQAGFTEQQGNQYQPCSNALEKVLKRFPITEQDAIIDIGCGKGKAMYLMSRFPFGQVCGYDLSEQLVDIANQNFSRLSRSRCVAFQADAAVFDNYDNFDYFYLFNSIPEAVFRQAMGHIRASIERKPRNCVLIYLNPVYHQYVVEHTQFQWMFTRKSWISWFDYGCYQLTAPGNERSW